MSAPGLPLAGLLSDALEAWMRENVFTALPGRVESFDASKCSADVKPLIKDYRTKEDGTVQLVSIPVVPGVPVVMAGGGGFRTTYPVAAGDTVLLVFARRSLDKWKSYGGEVDPADTRMFNPSDAVAISGLLPFNAPWSGISTSAMTAGKDGGPQIHFGSTDIKLGDGTATEGVAKGQSLNAALNTLVASIAAAAVTMSNGGTPTPVTGTQAAAFATAITTALGVFNSSATSALSTTVKVK